MRCDNVGGRGGSEEESIKLRAGRMMSLELSERVVKKIEVVPVFSAIFWDAGVALVPLETLGGLGDESVTSSMGAEVIMRCGSAIIKARMALSCPASQTSRKAVK